MPLIYEFHGLLQFQFGPWPIAQSEVFLTTRLSYAFVNLKPVVPGGQRNAVSLWILACYFVFMLMCTSDLCQDSRKDGADIELLILWTSQQLAEIEYFKAGRGRMYV